MNDPENTDVGNDPKICIRAYHLDDDVVVEGITDDPMRNVVIGMNELMQPQNGFLGWRSEGSRRPLDQGPDIDMEWWDPQMCN